MSLNLDNFIPSTVGTFLPQRATREDAPGRAEATSHRAIPSVPQAAPAGCLATTWGGLTMIRLRPRASDGVAEPRLQSLDPGRASERPFASGPPAVFPWVAPNDLPHQHGESPGTAQCQGRERQIWHARYYSFSFLFRPQQPHVLMSNPCGAAQQAAAPYHFAIN